MISKLSLVAASLGLSSQALGQNTTLTGLQGCDELLAANLGSITAFPADDVYEESRNTFYSQDNRNMEPNCVVQPTTTEQVSQVIKALNAAGSANWGIGIRSGGHSEWNNNAVYRGVNIDLSNFNQVELTTKSGEPWNGTIEWTGRSNITDAIARIRPAARWGDSLAFLESKGPISVTGGRSAHVGAGGLLVSGGTSYNMQQWGLSCDNVVNYEVVLSNGTIVEANREVNFDLFRALKGGSNNLGIVTRFDLRTFTVPPQGVFGGATVSPYEALDENIKQFAEYVDSIGDDGTPDHQFLVLRYDANGYAINNMLVSTDGNKNSSTFAKFGNTIPFTRDVRSQQPLSKIAATITDTGGSYYHSASLSIQPTEAMLQKSAELLKRIVEDGKKVNCTASFNFVHQPLPKMLASVNPGGNILGLDQSLKTNQVLWEVRATTPAADGTSKNAITRAMVLQVVEDLRQFSESQPNHSPYIYMNYASPTQNVLESYGKENVAFLRSVAEKYDPTSFFQDRVPGGYKIRDVPL